MSPEMIFRRPVWKCAAAIAVALLTASHAAVALAATQPYGGDSPQAVVERMRAAAESEDLGEMAACLSPDDRATLSMTMMMMTGMVVAFASMGAAMGEGMAEGMVDAFDEEMSEAERAAAQAEMEAKKAEAMAEVEALSGKFEAIIAKHGLQGVMEDDSQMEDADPAELLKDVDQVALLQDLMGFLEDLPGEESEEGEDGAEAPVDVPEGELTGLTVEGDTAHGMIGDEEVEFVQVDGRWYLSLDLMEQMRAGAGEMMEAEDEMEMEMEMEMDDGADDATMDDGGR